MKKLLIAIVIIIAFVIVAAIVAPFVVPVGTYKAKLIAAVKESTGRELRIDGPVTFHLLPQIELSADQVSLSNAPGGVARNMAQIKSLDIRLQLLPLLSGTVAIDSFVLVDPVIALEIAKNGRPNWEFSHAATAPTGATTGSGTNTGAMATLARLRVAHLKIENGMVSYVDARSGKHWSASAINMNFTMSGVDNPLSASGSVAWKGQTVNVGLTVERPGAFEGGRPTAIKLTLASAPINFSFAGGGVGAPAIKLDGNVDLKIPSVRTFAAWAGQPMPSGNGFGPLSIKGKVAVAGRRYTFSDAAITLDAIKGTGAVAFDDSSTKPYLKGSLALGDLDLNPYLGGGGSATAPTSGVAGSAGQTGAASGWSTAPIDVRPLKLVNADFFLGAQSIEYHKIKIGKSAVVLQLKNGKLTADLTQLALYNGSGRGKVMVDGSGSIPTVSESFALKNVDIQPLLHDAANVNLLSGIGNFDMSVEGRGRSQRDIVSSLAGKGALNIAKGKIKGVNIVGMMKNAANALSMGLTGSGNNTDFTTMSGTFTISNGILRNNDLRMVSSELPMTGAGTVDLPQRRVDYRLTPKVAGTVAVPVVISGPWNDLSYRPDISAIIKQPGKTLKNLQKLAPQQLQKLAPQQLQNLFGR